MGRELVILAWDRALRHLAAISIVLASAVFCACSGGLGTLTSYDGGGGAGNKSGGTGGSGATGGEICTNGIDDNNNKLVDCQDPACRFQTSCVQTPPPLWTGPVMLARAATPAGLPSCPGGATPAAEGGMAPINAPKLTCTACSCGKPSGGQCTIAASSRAYGAPKCINPSVTITPTSGTCYNFPYVSPSSSTYPQSLQVPAVTQSGSTCAPSGGQVLNRPAASFRKAVRVCSVPAGGGCPSGHACVERSLPGFQQGPCVMRSGQQTCPSGFPFSTLVYDPSKLDDTRACGACSCGTATGVTCSATLEVFSDKDCNTAVGGSTPVGSTTTCFPGGSSYESMLESAGSPTGGSCLSKTLPQTGTVTGTPEFTVCCM